MKKLICMTFDGDYITEYKGTEEECAYVSANMGSKWIFFPFHFILSESGKTITSTGYELEFIKGKRLKTVIKMFEELNNFLADFINNRCIPVYCDDFVFFLQIMDIDKYWKKRIEYFFYVEKSMNIK